MGLATIPAWAADRLPAPAEQITAAVLVDPDLLRLDLADGATAYVAKVGPAPRRAPRLYGQPLDAIELDMLARVARGWQQADIAVGTYGGAGRVQRVLARASRKLGARTAAHAVALAIAGGQLAADTATPPAPSSGDPR